MKYEDYCFICHRGIPEEDIYNINGELGHLECFEKVIGEYKGLKDKIHRRNMQIKELKEKIKSSIDRIDLSETLNYYLNNPDLEDKIIESLNR